MNMDKITFDLMVITVSLFLLIFIAWILYHFKYDKFNYENKEEQTHLDDYQNK
jgi:hypothetical protein